MARDDFRRFGSQMVRPSLVPDPKKARKVALAARVESLANECHLPSGPGGGRFCERLGSVKTRSTPLLRTHVAGSGPRMSMDLIPDKNLQATIDRQAQVPGFEDLAGRSGREVLDEMVDRQKDNILDAAEAAYAINPKAAALHATWYPFANKWAGEVAAETGVEKNAMIAAVAVLSPGADWANNVAWAKNISEKIQSDPVVTQQDAQAYYYSRSAAYETKLADHEKTQLKREAEGLPRKAFTGKEPVYPEQIVGKKLSELGNADAAVAIRGMDDATGGTITGLGVRQLGGHAGFGDPKRKAIPSTDDFLTKAVSVLRDPSADNVDKALGAEHKVRSFYENMRKPGDTEFSEVTVDTHHYGLANGLPWTMSSPLLATVTDAPEHAVSGVKGTYPLVVEATRKATTAFNKKHGTNFTPNQIQSVVWEYHRATYPEKTRGPSVQKAIGDIRTLRARGLISKREEKIRIEAARTKKYGDKASSPGPTIEQLREKYADDVSLSGSRLDEEG